MRGLVQLKLAMRVRFVLGIRTLLIVLRTLPRRLAMQLLYIGIPFGIAPHHT